MKEHTACGVSFVLGLSWSTCRLSRIILPSLGAWQWRQTLGSELSALHRRHRGQIKEVKVKLRNFCCLKWRATWCLSTCSSGTGSSSMWSSKGAKSSTASPPLSSASTSHGVGASGDKTSKSHWRSWNVLVENHSVSFYNLVQKNLELSL